MTIRKTPVFEIEKIESSFYPEFDLVLVVRVLRHYDETVCFHLEKEV